MTMHHCMTNTEQILDMVGPHRVSGEPAVLCFIWFHVNGVKLWDIVLFHPHIPPQWGAVVDVAAPTTHDHVSESWYYEAYLGLQRDHIDFTYAGFDQL